MLSNLVGTWSDNARLDVLNPQIGCAAEKSVATVGADVFFLSRTGVYRVLQVIQGRIQTAPVPVSDPIEPLIGRINWACADRAVAAVWGQYYLVAVPLDGATSNNVILRYNTVSDNWEGYDQPAFPWSVSRLLITDYLGRKRLMAVDFGGDGTDGTDGTNGTNPRVFVLDEGRDDIAGGVPHPIADLLETRGYTLGRSVEEKQFRDVSVAVATWNPRYTLEAITDGVNEAVTLAGYVTKSRTEYYHFGMPEYDASNANGDQGDYGRKDYSVVPNGVHLGEGIRLDLTQEWIEPQTLRATGRWVAFRITNNQGSCNVRAVRVAGAEMQTTKSTA